MASDDMKKMLMLIESCSCESNKQDTDEVTEGDEVDEMFFFKDTRSREEKNRDANKPQDILGRRPEQAIAKHGKEYKAMKKGTSPQDAADRERYGLGGPEGPLPENFEAFLESIRDMVGEKIDEAFRDANDRQDYVDYQHGELTQADKARAQTDKFAAQGAGNTALSPEQQARRNALASAKTSDANKRSAMAANPNFDRNSSAAEPWVHAKQASTSRNQVNQLTQKIRQAPRPQLPRESATGLEEQAQEDAEFQSFMETLNYMMRKK